VTGLENLGVTVAGGAVSATGDSGVAVTLLLIANSYNVMATSDAGKLSFA